MSDSAAVLVVGFDTASTITDAVLDRAVAKGVGFIAVYTKYMTPELVRRISARGIKIVTVFESSAQRALSGALGGAADGAAALAVARRCGQPDGSAIYCTADFGETADQDGAVLAYLQTFAAGVRPMKDGIYGEGAVDQVVLDHHAADYTWLAGGSGMRGTKDFAASGQASIVQDVGDKRGLSLGIAIDSDVATVDDFGGWLLGEATGQVSPTAAPPKSKPTPDQVKETIWQLQEQFAALTFYDGEVDGWGAGRTQRAMAAFVAAHPGRLEKA